MLPPTPTIEIHLAHDEEFDSLNEIQPLRSPYSPKCPSPMAYVDSDADDFRPVHLLPPPTVSPVSRPNKSNALPTDKKGIDQERFAELLKNSRERAAMKHGRKESLELRKQVTLKAHTTKALERRALFLSKIQSPPSPTSVDVPVTPPESPAIFHFTLPSPGMRSPLAVFEQLAKPRACNSVDFPSDPTSQDTAPRKGWTEEVDFKARARSNGIRGGAAPAAGLDLALPAAHQKSHARRASAHALPSLDQITARLVKTSLKQAPSEVPPTLSAVGGPMVAEATGRPRLNLPTHRRTPSSPLATAPTESTQSNAETPEVTAAAVNRLPAFLQKRTTTASTPIVQVSPPPSQTAVVKPTPPPVVKISSPPLRRRPSVPPPPILPSQPFTVTPMHTRLPFHPGSPSSAETRKQRGQDMVEKLRRRSSAPAALPAKAKSAHRVLSLKGGF